MRKQRRPQSGKQARRKQIMQFLKMRGETGSTVTELASVVDCTRQGTDYHLQRLSKEGRVVRSLKCRAEYDRGRPARVWRITNWRES